MPWYGARGAVAIGSEICRRPGRVELTKEQIAAFGLVGLTDFGGPLLQAGEAPEESTILWVLPLHVAAPRHPFWRSASRPR